MLARKNRGLGGDGVLRLDVAPIFVPLLRPNRHKGASGGRGGGKSHFFAELMVVEAATIPNYRAVCIREVQRSLSQSVKRLLEDKIQSLGLGKYFLVLETEIRTHLGGLIIFQGMQHHTADTIKSLEGYHRAWFEEAHKASEKSLRLLRPTLRMDGGLNPILSSQLWYSWNPEKSTDPIEQFFSDPPASTAMVKSTWRDNPWFPEVLRDDMARDYRTDPDEAAHTWGGEYWQRSSAQVFGGKWVVEAFEPMEHWDGPYHGADWGFSKSPTVLTRWWIADSNLYLEYEARGVGVDVGRATSHLFEQIPGARDYLILADCARPETISAMRKEGWRIQGAPKWPGSVKDGISWMRKFNRIVIHPRCEGAIRDFGGYYYRVDRLTEEPLPDIVEKNDHTPDAGRYALSSLIRSRKWGVIE